ncbi:hypothetical protein FRC0190_02355 [Corynebacterium rouxii]|uniref:Uncharacterized protein n=1 Tax=Corynebacterium rouxii TaxID=2719119 RepID=A0A6I8MF90_9CORY|nr:hypothetical protein FRC0190_02355 [Corynebacterium rouxii]
MHSLAEREEIPRQLNQAPTLTVSQVYPYIEHAYCRPAENNIKKFSCPTTNLKQDSITPDYLHDLTSN